MHKRWLAGLLFGCSLAAIAGSGSKVTMKDAEASMLLTGRITVDTSGHVTGFSVDHRDKVPAGVTQLVDSTVPTWLFKPVLKDGQAVPATTTMSMLVVASQPDATHYRIVIKGATFGDGGGSAHLARKSLAPPQYPVDAVREGLEGTVYVVLKIDRRGKVADAAVEQVNVRMLGTQPQLDGWRRMFATSTLRKAKHWTFTVPAQSGDAQDAFFNVRVPVSYRLGWTQTAEYGHWETYLPGPRSPIPWIHANDTDDTSPPDALVAGGVYQLGSGLHLLTPLGEG